MGRNVFSLLLWLDDDTVLICGGVWDTVESRVATIRRMSGWSVVLLALIPVTRISKCKSSKSKACLGYVVSSRPGLELSKGLLIH